MKLAKVEITNFRCFRSLVVELQPDITVVVGANGAGKTSVLDAIAIALYEVVVANGGGGKRQRAQQRAALQPTDILMDPVAEDALMGREKFVHIRASASDYYPVEGFPGTTSTGKPFLIEWSQSIVFRPPSEFIYDTRASGSLSDINRYFDTVWQEIRNSSPNARIPLPVVAYYRAHRRISAMPDLGDIFKAEYSREEAFANALDAGTDFRSMCQWFYLRENAELRAQVAEKRNPEVAFPDLRAVREALRLAIEGLARVSFEGSPPRLMITLRDADNTVRAMEMAQLSDGYRNLLALVLDFARRLAQAHPTWANPLEAPGILVVDEIELHLHPRWQQTVIPSLRRIFPNTQLILATHSASVIQTVRREQILLLASDHQFEAIPQDVGTYGAENSRVLAEVFGAYPRPQNIDTVGKLSRYLELIEAREQDSEHAESLRRELETAFGTSDPDLRRADMRIAQLKVLGKR